ncbi:MAG: hypothetical protein IT581_10020 [Verrucomicrobiales bacterium]|nr:hypothetical protein [Verrucomicrobiales bacterium]
MRNLSRLAPVVAVFLGWMASTSNGAVVQPSEVVFMYQGSRETYAAYGATVLAWGGKPNPKARAEAAGVRWFGSVGMVTEFSEFHRRFPGRYEEALCRDVHGKPVKVPWLTDHQSQGVPYWWCCTRQPLFQQFLRERVVETLQAGADGLHIDDHLGTAGGLWLGLCFCDRCVDGFRVHLAALPADERPRLGLGTVETFNFREEVRRWIEADSAAPRKVTDHPLWPTWTAYQCRGAAAFMLELRQLAERTAGHPVPVGANAGLLWPRHLSDYQALDLFTAETDHHAARRQFDDTPLFAYRLAEAMGRPYAATASGGDWAFIKENNLPGLVRGWIALSYAAGQRLMAPHHQWCYTPAKGTHWYDGSTERFAPLYRFVRTNATWFDGFNTYADLAVLLPHRSYAQNPQRWFDIANRLAATNLTYRFVVAGDEIVDRSLRPEDLASAPGLLLPVADAYLPADQAVLNAHLQTQSAFRDVDDAIAKVGPAVRLPNSPPVRVLPRVKPGAMVLHLLNYQYDPTRDDVLPLEDIAVHLDLPRLGVPKAKTGRWITPDADPVALPVIDGRVVIPRLGLWGLLAVED